MFKTQYNTQDFKEGFEKRSKLPSLTVPDQSLTITQVLTRYSQGVLPSIAKNPQYDYDETTSMATDEMDNISPFRRQNYDLADYTNDSNNNRVAYSQHKADESALKTRIKKEEIKREIEKAKDKETNVYQ